MKNVNHIELSKVIQKYYKAKLPLFIYGRFGIGKSAVVLQEAKVLAASKNKKFIDWNKTDSEEKEDLFKNPEMYFVLVDIRLSEYDSSDIKGLPEFNSDKKSIDFKSPLWALYMTNEGSDGILFFDEINLAIPIVQTSCYKIIHDRIINNSRVSNDWLILGAGNLQTDRAYIHDLAAPLKDRAGEVLLEGATVNEWSKWAKSNEIDTRILGYLTNRETSLYQVDFNKTDKFTTHRGWERVSKLINGERDLREMELIVSTAIGQLIADDFINFLKILSDDEVNACINSKEKLEKLSTDGRNALFTILAFKYKEKEITIKQIVKVLKAISKEERISFLSLLDGKDFNKGLEDEDNSLFKDCKRYLK